MADFLVVTWDGAGNQVPTLGIVRALAERGHGVTVLGHETSAGLFRAVGAEFVPLSQRAGWDAVDDPGDFEAEIRLMISDLWFGAGIVDDLTRELRRAPVDSVLVDCLLFTAIDAALASGVPTYTLLHVAYSLLRRGPLVDLLEPGLAALNAQRAGAGLPRLQAVSELHDSCVAAIVAVPKEFEPDAHDATNVVRIGAVLDAPPLSLELDDLSERDGSLPSVLVSLSTSDQGQRDLLGRCADAVAQLSVQAVITTGPSIDPQSIAGGENTQVVGYTPHSDILPTASLVITHSGLGTTLAALGAGVPLVCIPLGRDQFFNAGRVQALGAGLVVPSDASSDAIAGAAREVLSNGGYHAQARRLADAFATYPGIAGAVTALESSVVGQVNDMAR